MSGSVTIPLTILGIIVVILFIGWLCDDDE